MAAKKTTQSTKHTHASKTDAKAAAGNATLEDLPASPPAGASPRAASPPAASPPAAGAAAPGGTVDLVDMPLAQFTAAVQVGLADIAAQQAALPNPSRITQADLKTIGRLRAGESAVLQTVADICAMPQYAPLVASLADRDFGDDPNTFEPTLLKARLQMIDVLSPYVDALTSHTEDMSDTQADLEALSRPPLLTAYAILKTVAQTDPTLKSLLKDPLDYYAAIGKASAKTKKANAAAAATSTTAAAAAGASAAATPTTKS